MHLCEETAQAEVETRTDALPESTSPAYAGLFYRSAGEADDSSGQLITAQAIPLGTQQGL